MDNNIIVIDRETGAEFPATQRWFDIAVGLPGGSRYSIVNTVAKQRSEKVKERVAKSKTAEATSFEAKTADSFETSTEVKESKHIDLTTTTATELVNSVITHKTFELNTDK